MSPGRQCENVTSEERLRFVMSLLSHLFSKQNSPQLYKSLLLRKREQSVLHSHVGQEISDLHWKVFHNSGKRWLSPYLRYPWKQRRHPFSQWTALVRRDACVMTPACLKWYGQTTSYSWKKTHFSAGPASHSPQPPRPVLYEETIAWTPGKTAFAAV